MMDTTYRRRKRRWPYILLTVIVFSGLCISFYIWLMLHWSYSEGERAGVLQKFSRKGWLCKSYEGELAMYIIGGMAPQIWTFTVRDPKVAEQLNTLVGENIRVHYGEHRGLPTQCFGDTNYFVEGVSEVRE